MKKNYRVLSTITAVTMVTGTLAGCGSSNYETVATEAPATATETSYDADYSYSNTKSYDYTAEATCDEAATECAGAYVEDACETAAIDPYANGYWRYVEPNTESYENYEENGFNLVMSNPLSTFAADVDTASYSNVRRMIENGYAINDINPDAVRVEEFLNYFSYDLNDPVGNEKFGFTSEVSECPWNEGHKIMFVGMKTKDVDLREAPDSNLVFLIDVSGSMDDDNKLPLLKKSFIELVDKLPEDGTISIVTYSGTEKVVLSGESMRNKDKIKDKIDGLEADGCTNGERGIQKAYEIAKRYYIEGGNNRVIMATDGDLNVGISDPDELERFIEAKKDDGVFLSVLGFGMGNYKDDRLERLADCGNGNYAYIDSMLEAKKVLVDEMGGTLLTVAKDVKLQVEFNPARVNSYRLIGYENRVMDDADFNDDTKDGGEIGAGHSVVALYEFIPSDSEQAIDLKYQDVEVKDTDSEYATLSVRFKEIDSNKSDIVSVPVDNSSYSENPSQNLIFASMVTEFAMILKGSDNKGTSSLEDIMASYKKIESHDEYKDEFYQMVRMVAKRG